MQNNAAIGLLILRLIFGGVMLFGHGWRKLMKFFSEDPITFADPLGIGEIPSLVLTVFAEVFCSFLVIAGIRTRWAVLPLIFAMLVAIFVVHSQDPFQDREMAILYCAAFCVLFFSGGGQYAVDQLFKKTT